MFARVSRCLIGAVAISSSLAGCAHRDAVVSAADEAHARAEGAYQTKVGGINEFCANREWFCILAGLAVTGGVIAAISTSND